MRDKNNLKVTKLLNDYQEQKKRQGDKLEMMDHINQIVQLTNDNDIIDHCISLKLKIDTL